MDQVGHTEHSGAGSFVTDAIAPEDRVGVKALVLASCALVLGVVPNLVNFTSVPVFAIWALSIVMAFIAIGLAFIGMTRRAARQRIALVALIVALVSIPGSTVSLLHSLLVPAGNPVQQETAEGMRVTVKVLDSFDGYIGVGVEVENAGTTTLRFSDDDYDVFPSSGASCELPFGPLPPSGEIDGYPINAGFPSSLEPGETATTGFCIDANFVPSVARVISLNGGTLEFKL